MKIKSVFLLGPALLLASTLFAQAQGAPTMGPAVAPAPMTEKEVITELKKDGADQLLKDLDRRGVAFEMDADIEKRLRKAKATDQVIKAVTAAGPKERAAAAKAAAMASGAMVAPAGGERRFQGAANGTRPGQGHRPGGSLCAEASQERRSQLRLCV